MHRGRDLLEIKKMNNFNLFLLALLIIDIGIIISTIVIFCDNGEDIIE